MMAAKNIMSDSPRTMSLSLQVMVNLFDGVLVQISLRIVIKERQQSSKSALTTLYNKSIEILS